MENLTNILKFSTTSLYESLLDDMNKISKDNEKSIKQEIRDFLNKHYMGALGNKCKISRKPDDDGKYIVDLTAYNVQAKQDGLTHLTNSYFKFGTVTVRQAFCCHLCDDLESFEGAPTKLVGEFVCYGCPKLTSFEGAPKEISGDFTCYDCDNLNSIDGISEKVGGSFYHDGTFSEDEIRKHCEVRNNVVITAHATKNKSV